MSYNGFDISIYGSERLPIEKVLGVIRNLPNPLEAIVRLDTNNIRVLKGKLESEKKLYNPSKEQLMNFILDNEIRGALENLTLHFEEEDANEGNVRVFLSTLKPYEKLRTRCAADYSVIAMEVVKRHLSDWENIASVTHERGEKGKLDRKVFDYGKIVVSQLIPIGTEGQYVIIPSGLSDHASLMDRDDFLKNLDNLTQRNCEGASS